MGTTIIIAIGIFLILLALGAPVFVGLGVSAIVVNLLYLHIPATFVAQGMFTGVNSWVLLAVPFFLLSGNIMGECGPAAALFNLCDKFLGHLKGGLACAVISSCVLFGAITGSGIATAVAIGAIALPEMLKRGYPRTYCYGLIGMSGTLGLMIPPSIFMIIFASLVSTDVIQYFTAGWIPGIMIAVLLSGWALLKAPNVKSEKASAKEKLNTLKDALPALTFPVVILVSIYSGVFTPTESAALSVVYALFLCLTAYRKAFSWQLFLRAGKAAVSTTGQIYIIIGAVTSFITIITYLQIPQSISKWAIESGSMSITGMLLMITLVYFIFGMILDAVPILYLTIPIFYPAFIALGGNPVHLCILTVVMLMIAQCTPPFGAILFAMAGQFKEKVTIIIQGILPFIVITLIGAMLILFFPQISTILPHLLGYI